MLRNVAVNNNTFFYPVGNTPAVCLTQDLPRETDADVLLLGCGDARNILYTTYENETNALRKLDFVCCDIEAAILARNVLLFTLLIDLTSSEDQQIWNIYYHFKLDRTSLSILLNQIRKLCRISENIEQWSGSPYAKCITFCNTATLRELNQQWTEWSNSTKITGDAIVQTPDLGDAISKAREKRKLLMGDQGMSLGVVRSAAPSSMEALKEVPALAYKYWENGHLYEHEPETRFYNPTFVSTTNGSLILHYGTEPLLGYHLAEAFTPLVGNVQDITSSSSTGPSQSEVVRVARKQFSTWSLAFRKWKKQNLTLRFIQGDAIAVAMALRSEYTSSDRHHRQYNNPWTMDVLLLNNATRHKMPLKFDVIDTSNLIDHLGPLNIMTATRPLLKDLQTSILYTEVLVQHGSNVADMLADILCGDFVTVSLLLGLTPTEYLTNASMISNVEEGMIDVLLSQEGNRIKIADTRIGKQKRSRVCWRQARSTFHLEASSFAQFLFGMYLKMFGQESLEGLMSGMQLGTLSKLSLSTYSRASYVYFLAYIKQRNSSHWELILDELVKQIEKDTRLVIGRNYLQELHLLLHLLDLQTPSSHTTAVLRQFPPASQYAFSKWTEMPSVVAITFKVPRQSINRLLAVQGGHFSTPLLACTLQSPLGQQDQWSNMFAALQINFGSIQQVNLPHQDNFGLTTISDAKTWNGKSPMIVSFLAPTWVLLQQKSFCQLRLQIQSTPHAVKTFFKIFPELSIFETTSGSDSVYITKYMPNMSAHSLVPPSILASKPISATEHRKTENTLSLDLDDSRQRAVRFRHKATILAEATKTALSQTTTRVVITNETPMGLDITIGNQVLKQHIGFPIPIQPGKSLLRIARKSGYVEVVAPLASLQPSTRVPALMFPIITIEAEKDVSTQAIVFNWNAPYVVIERMPVLDLTQTARLQWLITHTSLMFSTRERELREASGPSTNCRVDMKDGPFSIFMHSSGLQGPRGRCFGLHKQNEGGVHVLIFVSEIRLDLGNHTIVLDAAVIPLTHDIMHDTLLQQVLGQLEGGKLILIQVSTEELKLWKANLPAFVERSRSWDHNHDKCDHFANKSSQYIQHGLEDGKSPLCSCGKGKVPQKFMKDSSIPALNRLLLKHATRAAISPCFAIPYVEDCFGHASGQNRSTTGSNRTTSGMLSASSSAPYCQSCCKPGGNGVVLLKCGRCKVATYCSADCQKKDWKSHKGMCKSA